MSNSKEILLRGNTGAVFCCLDKDKLKTLKAVEPQGSVRFGIPSVAAFLLKSLQVLSNHIGYITLVGMIKKYYNMN